jgi:ThiF family
MSQKQISLSPDLKRLRDDGYNIEIRAAYVLLKDVPYVTPAKEVKRGVLVSKLTLAGDVTARPDDHQVQFAGEYPCHRDGSPMTELANQALDTKLDDGLTVKFSFSQKPPRGYYEDYHEKMTTYAAMLTGHAEALQPGVTARVYRVDEPEEDDDSPFNYLDTASSRAEINAVTRKLALGRVAIVGLGGTGSYVLDLVAKTPVKEIHLYDGDVYSTHNAFRSPSAPSIEELREQPKKVAYFKRMYAKMHRGIVAHEMHIDASNVDELRGMNFVFLCMDQGEAKRVIVQKLEEFGVSFVDVGMGLYLKNETLGGILRVTTSTAQQRAHVHEKGRIPLGGDDTDNEYDKNIQIADLNSLNAALAVIKWKKLYGFYADHENEFFSTYTINCNMLTSEDAL